MNDRVLCMLYIFFSLSGMTFIKMGAENQGYMVTFPVIGMGLPGKMLFGMLLYGVSFLLYVVCITKMQIGITIPLLAAINSCLIVVIGIVVFKEKMNAVQALGVFTVIAGALVIGIGSR